MILNEDFDTLVFDDEDYGESGEVEPGVPFDDGGETYYWKECVAGPIHIDFDNWAAWSAISEDDEIVYFVVDEDTGFIDWGPEDSEEAIIQFLYGKLDDEELDEDIDDKEKKYSISGKDTSAQDFYKTVSNDNLSDDEINKIENGEEVKRGGKSYSIKNEDLEVADITEESVPPMPEGTDSTISNMLIELINGEWNTIADYNDFVNACKQSGNTDLVSIIEDITNEEANHVGMLQTALKTLSPNTETIEDGQEEAEKDLQDS